MLQSASGRVRVFTGAAIVALAVLLATPSAVAQTSPVAGQNINMVSGTSWPGGDPFLQRQNEPSLAVSSRNPLHILAGANDYRTVDIPVSDTVPGSLAGDAWLGVFKSFDGGLTWQSYLLPGYPQDQSAAGLASPLKAYNAAADPTVRAGTGGALYYSGIAFNRGTNNGAVFVTTFFDTNQKENGNAPAGTDAMQYQRTVVVDTGTSGQFLDKTWIAVDIPRAGAATCTFPGLNGQQNIKAGNVYLVWSRFTGSTSTKIMFSRSLDCGKTWSNPTKLSESSSINQGTNLAIDPTSGKVYAAWRQFATSSNPDSIQIARSDDFGKTFASKNTYTVATIPAPFDQSMSGTRFRTNTLPTVAASVSGGSSYVHVAWAQRPAGSQDARIVVSTSSNSGQTWSTPALVDNGAVSDDYGNNFSNGHQFMPQLTFAAGRLMLVYYDQRLDHTLSLFYQSMPDFGPDGQGRFYLRKQAKRAELISPGTSAVFKLFIDDDASILTKRRHTIDLRVADALPSASPIFSSTSVSQYRMGLFAPENGVFKDDEDNPIDPQPPTGPMDHLYQLQVNAPNLPMFSQGTLPFLGDYIDIAGQNFVANPVDGTWSYSTAASTPPVFYATWTDNRDVVPPVVPGSGGLVDWTKYTPPVSPTNLGDGTSKSILDPTQKVPACSGPYTGSRNQNIYLSRVTEGLLVGSPQDAKPLFVAPKQRAFVVTAQNLTNQSRTFTFSVTPATGVTASFLQGSSAPSLTGITIPARSGAARPVFASSANSAGSLTVSVTETTANCNPCLSGSVVLNPEGSVPPMAQPDGSTDLIGSVEVYTPTFAVWNPANANDPNNPNPYVNITDPNQNISNQNISNQNISNADPAIQNISNQNISNQNISNQNISNQNISNPSPAIQNISNQNISNQNISNVTVANQNISNQNISNQNISNQNISNAPYTDANYAILNSGNTTHSYRVSLYGNSPSFPLQVIATKNSQTPVAVGCTLQSVPQSTALAQGNGAVTSLADAQTPHINDGSADNVTIPIGPGETVFLTLRGQATRDQMLALVQQLTPVVTAHGANTGGGSSSFALLLSFHTVGGTTLPDATFGAPYTYTPQTVGGQGPLQWAFAAGSGNVLPGLTIDPATGVISGTPTAAGSFTFTIQVKDSTSPAQTASQTLNLTVQKAAASVAVTSSAASSLFGQSVTLTATVTATPPASGTPTGSVTFYDNGTQIGSPAALTGNVATLATSTLPVGGHSITAVYAGDTNFSASNPSPGFQQTVGKAATSTTVTAAPNPSVFGQSVTVTATVAVTAPGSGTPTGSVTFYDNGSPIGSPAALSGGTATLPTSTLSVGGHSITAVYAGDANFSASSPSPAFPQTVGKAATSTTVGSSANPSVFGSVVTFTASVAATAPGAGTPTGNVTFYDGGVALGSSALSGSTATLSTAALAGGVHMVTASYAGDGNFTGSSSAALAQTVSPAGSSTTLASSPNPSAVGQSVTFTATVTSGAGVPTGSVNFLDGTTVLGSGVLSGTTATFSTSALAAGAHSITAAYVGDASHLPSTSAVLTQTVNAFFTFTGFLSPMATAGTVDAPSFSGSSKYGSAQPVKWQLQDASGNYIGDTTTASNLSGVPYQNGACSGKATGTPILLYSPTAGAKGGSTFRYDSGTHQFIFNWNTGYMGSPGCYELELQLSDGSAQKATIEQLTP